MTMVDIDEPYDQDFPAAARPAPQVDELDWIEEAPPRPVVPPAASWPTPAPRLPDPAETVASYIERTAANEAPEDAPPVQVQVVGVGFLSRWLASNPVRVWLYGVVLAAVAILVSKGLLSQSDAYLWSALGAAVFGVPFTEAVRGSVYSPRGAAAVATQAVLEDRSSR